MSDNPHGFERDVPIPPPKGVGRAPKYPFKFMQPGDSKKFTGNEEELKRIQRAVTAFSRRNKVKMITRRYPDEGYMRVWREA